MLALPAVESITISPLHHGAGAPGSNGVAETDVAVRSRIAPRHRQSHSPLRMPTIRADADGLVEAETPAARPALTASAF